MSDVTTPGDLVGGHPALDFVNTAGGSTKARDVERLVTFDHAAAWGRVAGLVDDGELAALRTAAAADPGAAAAELGDLRGRREALHATLLAAIEGREPDAAARERVQGDVVRAHTAARLAADLRWEVPAGLEVVGLRLGLAVSALLAGDDRTRVSVCARCSWMFLDRTPSRRRRWCSMAVCGNRAKVARHADRGTP